MERLGQSQSQIEKRIVVRRLQSPQGPLPGTEYTPGWRLLARRSRLPREQALPAEERIAKELRGQVTENNYDSSLRFSQAIGQTPTIERWMWNLSGVFGNPFKRVDALGESEGFHPMRVHSVYANFRDSLRAIRNPRPEPGRPGLLGFIISLPPGTSTVQDFWAFTHIGNVLGNIPGLNRMPYIRKIVPTPGQVTRDVLTIVSDVGKLGGVGFAIPGSVWTNRNADFKANRVIETYLPQVARRELEDATVQTISRQGARIFGGIDRMVRSRANEIVETQDSVMRLLNETLGERDKDSEKQPSYNLFGSRSVLGFFGKLHVKKEVWHDLSQSEVTRIKRALDEGRVGIQEVTRLMSGLDALAAVHHVMRLTNDKQKLAQVKSPV